MAFYYQRRYVAKIMRMAQKNYYKEKLLENKYCTKEIYRIANTLLHWNEPLPLPTTEGMDMKTLANGFNEYFINKIITIMEELKPSENNPINNSFIESDFEITHRLMAFEEITAEQLDKIL